MCITIWSWRTYSSATKTPRSSTSLTLDLHRLFFWRTELTVRKNTCANSQATSSLPHSTPAEAITNPGEMTLNLLCISWYTCWMTTTCRGATSRRNTSKAWSSRMCWENAWKLSTPSAFFQWSQVRYTHSLLLLCYYAFNFNKTYYYSNMFISFKNDNLTIYF